MVAELPSSLRIQGEFMLQGVQDLNFLTASFHKNPSVCTYCGVSPKQGDLFYSIHPVTPRYHGSLCSILPCHVTPPSLSLYYSTLPSHVTLHSIIFYYILFYCTQPLWFVLFYPVTPRYPGLSYSILPLHATLSTYAMLRYAMLCYSF